MQDWHFNIEALVTTAEGETVTIYPENFTNPIFVISICLWQWLVYL